MNANQGYFGIGIYQPKRETNVGTLWRSARILGASFLFTIGHRYRHQCSDTMKAPRHVPLFSYESFDAFLKALPACGHLIAIELDEQAAPISNFVHPQQAVYLLGAEDYGLPPAVLNKCRSIVQLPGDFCLNVAVAGSIAMYDRISKCQ